VAQSFSKPQKAHLLTVLLGVLLRQASLTLEKARRIAGGASSLSSLTRFLDSDQWEPDDLWLPVRSALLAEAIRRASPLSPRRRE
jgi:hypothetical protein